MSTTSNSVINAAFAKARIMYMIAGLIICVCVGFGYAWSVLQNPIITAHNWPASQVALAYPITVVCSTMAPLLFGSVIRRLSTRTCVIIGAVLFGAGLSATGTMGAIWQLYLFYGVMAGLGCGFIYPCMMAYVVRLFPERAGMASGLGTAAYGSGAIFWAPIAVSLTNRFSLSTAFRILGVLFLIIILICSVLLHEPPKNFREAMCPNSNAGSLQSDSGGDMNRGQMLRTRKFYQMAALFTCGLVSGVIIISQSSPILQQTLSFTPAAAAIFVSIFSACNMLGRFIWGSLSDKFGIRRIVSMVFVVCILSMIVLAVTASKPVIFIIAMGLAASCYGGFASVLTPITSRVFGAHYITENYGVMYVVFGIASLIGPNLAVSFKSSSGGSYIGAFLTAAILAVIGLVLFLCLKLKNQ